MGNPSSSSEFIERSREKQIQFKNRQIERGKTLLNKLLSSIGGSENEKMIKVEKILTEKFKGQGRDKDISANTLIGLVFKIIFEHYLPMFPDEFSEICNKKGIAKMLVDEFAEDEFSILPSYRGAQLQNDVLVNQNLVKRAKAETLKFVHEEYSGLIKQTLRDFLESRSAFYEIPVSSFFDSDVKMAVEQKIRERLGDIAKDSFRGFFDSGETAVEKDLNAQNFIMEILLKRVIRIEEDKVSVNGENLEKLIRYLDMWGYLLEDLYILVFENFALLKKVMKIRNEILREVSGDQEVQKEGRGKAFADLDFDVFFRENFTPTITKIRGEKLKKLKVVRLVDVLNTDPGQIEVAIYPEEAIEPVRQKLEDLEGDSMREIRQYFNYVASISNITDSAIEKELGKQLGQCRDIIEGIISKAIKHRTRNSELCEMLTPPKEVLSSTDIRELLRWISDPGSFYAKFPELKNDPRYKRKFIRHWAILMIKMLHLYRKKAFAENFVNRTEERDRLQFHMKNILEMSNQKVRDVKFRVYEEVDPVSMVPLNGDKKQMVMIEGVDDVGIDEKFFGDETGVKFVNRRGILYKFYPVESKKFLEVKIKIRNRNLNEKKADDKIKILIYIGEGGEKNFMHVKSLQSYFSSLLRGKEPTDLIRWMIATTCQEEENLDERNGNLIRNFLYANYSSSGTPTTKDAKEGRQISNKNSPKTSASAKEFQENRSGSFSFYYVEPKLKLEDGEEGISHNDIGFETQIFGLRDLLVMNLSAYTSASHESVYTPKREYATVFKHFFPPILYGKEYALEKLKGFNYID